ncbi:MAG: pyrroline-5-carboxylate reductase family protein, partial [Candidatus Levyibacteriota bacterium]
MDKKRIAILGAGHIGTALLQGLLSTDKANKEYIIATDPNAEHLKNLQETFGIITTTNNREAVEKADIIILAVKPMIAQSVITEIADRLKSKILISFALGVRLATLAGFAKNTSQKIVRVMPNMPIAMQQGAIGFLANEYVSQDELKQLMTFFSQLGKMFVTKTEEEFIFFSLIPGCGPALVSYFLQTFVDGAKAFGLSQENSQEIARQVFSGTLRYLQFMKISPKELMEKVATKGGVTEKILSSMEEKNISKNFLESVQE